MPPVYYTVTELGVVKDAFRALLNRAAAEGRLPIVLAAARYLLDELAYAPAPLGESRGRLESLDQERRITYARPLVAEFIIHEPTRTVTVIRVRLLD